MAAIKVLDHARALGALADVQDEGGFWDKRNVRALAAEVGDWNTMMVGWNGRLKATFGDDVDASIDRPTTTRE